MKQKTYFFGFGQGHPLYPSFIAVHVIDEPGSSIRACELMGRYFIGWKIRTISPTKLPNAPLANILDERIYGDRITK